MAEEQYIGLWSLQISEAGYNATCLHLHTYKPVAK